MRFFARNRVAISFLLLGIATAVAIQQGISARHTARQQAQVIRKQGRTIHTLERVTIRVPAKPPTVIRRTVRPVIKQTVTTVRPTTIVNRTIKGNGIPGPRGPRGPQGPRGATGPIGPTPNISGLVQRLDALIGRVCSLLPVCN